MDICWQKQVHKSTKYLYTLSKKHRLCRHPVAYELAVFKLNLIYLMI